MATTRETCHCQKVPVKRSMDKPSMLTGLLIALLPKCPFCILAFTSSAAVCGGAGIIEHAPVWTSYISIGLAALTMSFIGLNFRGTRTWYALALTFLGGSMIAYAELVTGSLAWYQAGAGLLVLGVWVNGSLLYFLGKAHKWISRWSTKEIVPVEPISLNQGKRT